MDFLKLNNRWLENVFQMFKFNSFDAQTSPTQWNLIHLLINISKVRLMVAKTV